MDTLQPSTGSDIELFRNRFQQEPDSAFALSDDGRISWSVSSENGGESRVHVIGQLVKSENFYAPAVEIIPEQSLGADEIKVFKTRLETWISDTVKKKLAFLFILENAPLKGTAKGIAFRLFEEHGIIFRPRIQDLVKPLELTDRQALSRLGVRIGSHYVYAKDCLKPASVRLMGILWRIFHPGSEHAVTPHDGNVSFAVPENAPKRFYLTVGYPIFGDLAVRADMIERLNSMIFEKAVNGEYTFDPAIASTIGASVEQTHKVLADLGFPSQTVTRPKQAASAVATEAPTPSEPTEEKPAEPDVAAAVPEETAPADATAVTEATAPETETVIVYSLKRVKPHREEKKPHGNRPAPKKDKKDGNGDNTGKSERPRHDKKGGKPGRKDAKSSVAAKAGPSSHGHNAFAGLDQLLKLQEKK